MRGEATALETGKDQAVANLPAEEAVPRLFDTWGDRIYGLGLSQCRDPHDAEDLVQETFLQAFRKWDQFEGRSKPSTWLYTIASRACMRKRRKRSGEPQRMESLSELLPVGEPRITDLPADDRSPLDEHLRREARETLEAALQDLPHSFRLALVLKDIAALPVAEVADVLGIKEATVKTRVHRARLLLRKRLAETLPKKDAPPPDHPRSVCFDLLRGKQEALDRGVDSPQLEQELCSRCSALFSTLDLTRQICADLGSGRMPEGLRTRLLEDLD
jgi:RNA polymerase sigma-70 factor (ECF subfamily)